MDSVSWRCFFLINYGNRQFSYPIHGWEKAEAGDGDKKVPEVAVFFLRFPAAGCGGIDADSIFHDRGVC
jgi:hypothetical protein